MDNNMVNEAVETVKENVVDTVVENVEPVKVETVVRNQDNKAVIYAAIGAAGTAAVYGVYKGVRYAVNKWGKPAVEKMKNKRAAKKEVRYDTVDKNETEEPDEFYDDEE